MRPLFPLALLFVFLFSVPASANDARALAERLESRALSGDQKAAYKLGLLFSDGKLTAPDDYTAADWFLKSAKLGNVKGMLRIGEYYVSGKGGTQDYDQARYWNQKAAKAGSRQAMIKLGELSALQNDLEDSAYWYRRAAIKGDAMAMRTIGTYYLQGKGVRFDLNHAYAWLSLADEKGERGASAPLRQIRESKDADWLENVQRAIENRMLPEDYWNAR